MQKNKKLLTILLSVSFMVVITIAGALAIVLSKGDTPVVAPGDDTSVIEPPVTDTPVDPPAPTEPDGIVKDTTPVSFNKPGEMRAVYLVPGVDILTSADRSEFKIKQEIDAAIKSVKNLTMNTLVIDTKLKDELVLYKSEILPTASASFDVLDYIITKARENNLYVYAIYDVILAQEGGKLTSPTTVDGTLMSQIAANAKVIASYKLDGVMLRSYYNETQKNSYASYLKAGGTIGFSNYMTAVPDNVVKLVSDTIRAQARGVQVGLVTDPVWENKSVNEAGSATAANFTVLSSANADVKSYIEAGLVDFISAEAYGSLTDKAVPFNAVVSWWGKLANQNDIELYVVQSSDKICTNATGWSEANQITKQVIDARAATGYSGSIFNSLTRLVANPNGATDLLVKYYKEEIKAEFILTELEIQKPAKTTYTTEEATVTFTGASDPTVPVKVNDKEIATDKNGYFTQMYELKAGVNTFVITHKDKTLTYNITRNVKVLKEISPVGSVAVDGGMEITVTAMAYKDSVVQASLGGATVTLSVAKEEDDNTNKESSYVKYTGVLRAPNATGSSQSVGNIKVSATWQGKTESLGGASVSVNKLVDIGDGKPVIVTATEAETFPSDRLNDISDGDYYPLAKGTLDYTVGNQIVYKEGSSTFSYYNLASGLRVYANTVTSTSTEAKDNKIRGLTVTADNRYTDVILNMSQTVSYTLRYSASQITIKFHNTASVPANLNLNKNPLFTSATWSGSTLTLKLRTSGGFLGYKAVVSSGKITFKFNNPPAMSGGGLGGAVIVIDPGHGGSDPGALGFHPSYHEREINAGIAADLAAELRGMGATVTTLSTKGGMSLQSRVQQAGSANPHLFISVHNNSAGASAAGSEAFYFRDFASGLASRVSSGAASGLGTSNRGDKYGLYYVTRVSAYAAVLAECGFVTNQAEYNKLIDGSYQGSIASNIASGVKNYFASVGGGTVITGTQSVGESDVVLPTAITLDKTTLSLKVGETQKLIATVTPDNAVNKTVIWSSADDKIATVDKDGNVKGIKEGTVKITAKTEDNGLTATSEITVTPANEVVEISLDATTLGLKTGELKKLAVTVKINGAAVTTEKVIWGTSNALVATVDGEGNVRAIAPGTAKITATSQKDTSKTAVCDVTVTALDKPVDSIAVNKATLELTEGATEKLSVTITPTDATNTAITWTTADGNIATVAADGTVRGIKAGTVVITATSNNGKTAICTVTVKAASKAVESISVSKSVLDLLEGASEKLTITITPPDATDKTIIWTTADGSLVTIGADGTVYGAKAGVAVITATSHNGKTATCTVTVTAKPPEPPITPPEQPEIPPTTPETPPTTPTT